MHRVNIDRGNIFCTLLSCYLTQGFWTYNIRKDKTLFCACVDNFKQNGVFWCHCACADNFKQNGVFWSQHLPTVRVWTWPKYNKHHHDLKNQLYPFVDMYIGKIFWPTAPCRGCPEKEIWRQGYVVFGSFFDSDETSFCCRLRSFSMSFSIDWAKVFDFTTEI